MAEKTQFYVSGKGPIVRNPNAVIVAATATTVAADIDGDNNIKYYHDCVVLDVGYMYVYACLIS